MQFNEIIVIASSKDEGFRVIDLHSGTSIISDYKNCLTDPSCVSTIGGPSSFSGTGGDYIAISQSKKPVINIYEWSKSQPHMICHVQEITTALVCDDSGSFLFGGSRGGRVYCWDIPTGSLIQSWQAHFKTVTKLCVTSCGMYLASSSEDGVIKIWEVSQIVSCSHSLHYTGSSKVVNPYRSWSAHTLPAKSISMIGSGASLRVVSCSLDRGVAIYDVHADTRCFMHYLPSSLESMTVSCTEDLVIVGSSIGKIFILDLSHRPATGPTPTPKDSSHMAGVLEGHTRSVTSLSMSMNNVLLASGSEDGTVRIWDVWTRQCVREIVGLKNSPISNVLVIPRPELMHGVVQKPSLAPIGHLRKYLASGAGESPHGEPSLSVAMALGPGLLGRTDRGTRKQLLDSPDRGFVSFLSAESSLQMVEGEGIGQKARLEDDVLLLPQEASSAATDGPALADPSSHFPGDYTSASEGIGSRSKKRTMYTLESRSVVHHTVPGGPPSHTIQPPSGGAADGVFATPNSRHGIPMISRKAVAVRTRVWSPLSARLRMEAKRSSKRLRR